MSTTVLAHPIVAAAIWRAWFETRLQPERRSFRLRKIRVAGAERSLDWRTRPFGPFATLSEVVRADREPDRQILLIPPLSGGFAFIMRDVAARFAATSRVRVLEWRNARFVPAAAGDFLLDDQAALIADAIRSCGERPHVVALCQAGGPTLTGAAMVQEEGQGLGAASLSLIASPIHASASSSVLSGGLNEVTLSALEASFAPRVTPTGDLRRVFPATAQFAALTATLAAQRPDRDEFSAMILDSVDRPEPGIRFLDLVSTYMDVPAEFMVDNFSRLYLGPSDALPAAQWRGEPVDLRALDETPMAVVEGGLDPIAPAGQTVAAFAATPGANVARERILIEDAGHFSLFFGPAWRGEVFPRLTRMIETAEGGAQ